MRVICEDRFMLKEAATTRSSRLQMLFKIGVLKNFAIFTGKHPCWSLFKIKLQAWKPFLPKHHLFQELIYEIQNNLHQLTTHMLTLIMWHNRFSENENQAVEAHIPRHRHSKTKKPRHRVSTEFWPLCPLIRHAKISESSKYQEIKE